MTLTGLAFVLAYFSGLGLALFRHPLFGVYTYIAVFYLHPPSRWWGALLPDLRWSLLAAVVTLLASLRHQSPPGRAPWYSNTAAKVLIAYTLWLWIQSFWALDRVEHSEAAVLFSKYLLLFYLFYKLVDTPTALHRVLLVHVAGCFYLGWLAFGADSGGRLEGVGGPGINEANALAMQLATGVVAGAMLLLAGRRNDKIFAFATMPFLLNGVVLAGSRGAFLALICAGIVLAMFKPPQHKRLFYAYAALAVILFGLVASQMFWERMGTITAAVDDQQQMDTSAESRFVIAAAQWKMTLRYPFGSGHRGTAVLSPLYLDEKYLSYVPGRPDLPPARSSHNTFMTALSEQGFIGGFLFVALWWWCARESLRQSRIARAHSPPGEAADVAAVAAALVVIFIAGIFVDYLKAEVQLWMVALLAASSSMQRLKDQEGVDSTVHGARAPRATCDEVEPRRARAATCTGHDGIRSDACST